MHKIIQLVPNFCTKKNGPFYETNTCSFNELDEKPNTKISKSLHFEWRFQGKTHFLNHLAKNDVQWFQNV
jgi:hypothetical protein